MTSCSSTFTAADEAVVIPISPAEAARLHNRAGVEFVDPRPEEVISATTGRIPGGRVIPLSRIEAGDLPPAFADRSIHVVTSCQAGPMAARAAAAFSKLGFARVSYVSGGTQAWVDAGLPTVR
ncbi:rhodanese-like domain-containing protein [Tropicimonas sediminicola]|uniref:Rhodanese-related sulfurtransferase n=1 Tax=Tropicimonas sediminicola TaxID=1031541 RepID=A0A239FWC6_9RHOB|nr:rhodanese-like domain-containing protein [Tropicimonas sediminicola]SNS60124.1 Rhodanese-related sulfurtransferase [Tropicimonas sediminicola]